MRHEYKQPLTALVLLSVLTILPIPTARAQTDPGGVERWGIYEVTLKGPVQGNPFLDVNLSAQFTHDEKTIKVGGFYDGEGIYRIRFMPDEPGEWKYATTSNAGTLNGAKGAFVCIAPSCAIMDR